MKTKTFFTFFIFFISIQSIGIFALDFKDVVEEWTIVPGINVGPIVSTTSEQSLVNILGKNNVIRTRVYLGEGEYVNGTLIFPKSRFEAEIVWKGEYSKPEYIRTVGDGWVTENGVRKGLSLEALIRINGGHFGFTGFEWDYPGRVVDWKNGKLSNKLMVKLDFDVEVGKDITIQEFMSVTGDATILSSLPVLKKMNLKMSKMWFSFE